MSLFAKLSIVLLLCSPVLCSAQDAKEILTEAQVEELLKQLDTLNDDALTRKQGKHGVALAAYRSAAASNASAYEFFVECTKLVNFDQKEKRFSEYRDWKSRTKELKSVAHCTALRYQLNWLILTIAADNTKDVGELIPKIYSAMSSIVMERESLGRYRGTVNYPVTESIFAQAYGLDQGLRGVKGWEPNPLDINGIFDKTIMPYYRATEEKEPLMGAWDLRIKLLSEFVIDKGFEQAKIDFTAEVLPNLRWQKMKDLFSLGDHATASVAMVGIIKENLGHKDSPKWIDELKGLLADRLEEPVEEEP
jgi:hypothetical protein